MSAARRAGPSRAARPGALGPGSAGTRPCEWGRAGARAPAWLVVRGRRPRPGRAVPEHPGGARSASPGAGLGGGEACASSTGPPGASAACAERSGGAGGRRAPGAARAPGLHVDGRSRRGAGRPRAGGGARGPGAGGVWGVRGRPAGARWPVRKAAPAGRSGPSGSPRLGPGSSGALHPTVSLLKKHLCVERQKVKG